jgi:hypothetical protein
MRFSDTGLAGQQHGLAFPFFRLQPAAPQQFVFFFTADEGRGPARVQRLEAVRRRTWPKHRPDLYRRRNTLQVPRPEVLELKEVPKKPPRAFADNDHVGLGDALESGRKVWGLADDAGGQIAHHDHPRRDADPELLGNTRL